MSAVELRNFHTLVGSQFERKACWSRVLKTAERALGFPASTFSLPLIFNDQMKDNAHRLVKLAKTNHPICKTMKELVVTTELPTWGLITLLFSKAAGVNSTRPGIEWHGAKDIPYSLKNLAEVTEVMRFSSVFHKDIINIGPKTESFSSLHLGNKLALLIGDYLLSLGLEKLALIKNYQVLLNIEAAMRDLSESEFFGFRDEDNNPVPSRPLFRQDSIPISTPLDEEPFQFKNVMGNMKAEWVLRNILSGGSLLGKSCQCAMVLEKREEDVQQLAYRFGRSLALAWQVALERNCVQEETFSLVSAPVMLHLEGDPQFYREIEKDLGHVKNVDYSFVRKAVIGGSGLQKTVALQEEFEKDAREVLDRFADSEAKAALINLIDSLV